MTARTPSRVPAFLGLMSLFALTTHAIASTVYTSQGVTNPQHLFDKNSSTYAEAAAGHTPSYCPVGFKDFGDRCHHRATGTEFHNYAEVGIKATQFLNPHKEVLGMAAHVVGHCQPPRHRIANLESHLYVWKPTSAEWEHLVTFQSPHLCEPISVEPFFFVEAQSEVRFVIARSTASDPSLNRWGEILGETVVVPGAP